MRPPACLMIVNVRSATLNDSLLSDQNATPPFKPTLINLPAITRQSALMFAD
jgi:hypothetical protein